MSRHACGWLVLALVCTFLGPVDADDEMPKLDGRWEILLIEGRSAKETGLVAFVEQSGGALTAKYAYVHKGNKYGIRRGFDFFRATVDGLTGQGKIATRKGDVRTGEPVVVTRHPCALKISKRHDWVRITVQGEDVEPGESIFLLVRPAPVVALRLYVKTPAGLQPATKMIEDVPMVVEAERKSRSVAPVDIVLRSGGEGGDVPLKLQAVRSDDVPEKRRGLLFRTREFIPTFEDALGVDKPPADEDREDIVGREPTGKDWAELVGTYKTVYRDAVLGNVEGWARIDKYGNVGCRYRHPLEDTWHELTLAWAWMKEGAPAGEVAAVAKEKEKEEPTPGSEPKSEGEPKPEAEPAPKWTWILQFKGVGVVSDKVESLELGDMPRLSLASADPEPISITAATLKAEVGLKRRQAADAETVTLELSKRESSNLFIWEWSYLADRGTGRDRYGLGRVGVLLPPEKGDSSIAPMKGREAWLRTPSRVVAAIVTENQLAFDESLVWEGRKVPKYRYGTLTRKVKMGDGTTWDDKMGPSGNPHRHVFVVATDLPPGNVHQLRMKAAEGSGVTEYRVLARATEAHAFGEIGKAWKAYREVLEAMPDDGEEPVVERRLVEGSSEDASGDGDEKAAKGPPEPEGVLLLAIFEQGTPPGYQDFTLNGAEGRWRLLYGDAIAKLEIVRMTGEADEEEELPPEWEVVTTAYVPERVRVSVRTPVVVEEQKTIDVAVAVDKTIGTIDGKKVITLKPDPHEPGRYLSAPIELVRVHEFERLGNRAGEITLPAKNGSRLKAMVGADSGYLVHPVQVKVRVLDSPAKINRLWKEAVLKAARIAGNPVEDWNKVARGEAGAATNLIITNYLFNSPLSLVGAVRMQMESMTSTAEALGLEIPKATWWRQEAGSRSSVREIPISVGDHAAMLLLRDEFQKMMREQIADWQRNQSQSKINAIYGAQRRAIGEKKSPLSFFAVPLHKVWGFEKSDEDEEVLLYKLFDDEFLEDEYDVVDDEGVRSRIQRSAYEYAYRNWGGKMRAAVQDAANIKDGDWKELLKLTGYGFEPVSARVLPQMMKLADDEGERRSRWVPDHVARSYIRGLVILGAAVKAQEEYAEADTAVMLAVAALVSIPLGNIGGFWTAMAALSLSVVDAVHAIYTDIYGNWKKEEQLQREVGLGAVLGYGRAAATEAKIKSGWEQALSVGGALLGVGADTATVVRAVRAAKAMNIADLVDEGERVMRQVDFADPSKLRALSKQDQAVLARLADDADALVKAGKGDELTDAHRTALKHQKAIDGALAEVTDASTAVSRAADAPPLPVKVLKTVTEGELDKAIKHVDDLTERASKHVDDLKKSKPAPHSPDEARLQQAKDEVGDLKVRKQVLQTMKGEAAEMAKHHAGKGSVQVSKGDMALLRGRRMPLNQLDRTEAARAIEKYGSKWKKIKELEDGTGQDQLLLHKIGMYRRAEINRLADESMAEVSAVTGGKHRRKALGSQNLSSDYDVSIEGPDAELAVALFKDKARAFFGGRESGTVIDSNLYTDPIYDVYKASELAGKEGKLTQAEFDATRQFVFQQMANAKYRPPKQYKALRKRMLDGLPRGVRKPMSDLLDQAEGAKVGAESALRSRIAEAVEQGAKQGEDLELRVNNDLYAESLVEIHGYRKLAEHLDAVRNGWAKAMDAPLPPALRGPPYDELLPKIHKGLYGSDPVAKAVAKDALDQLHGRAVLNMRSKQGEALYYAAEAYQARGTISHVVGELQAGEVGKILDADELLDGVRRKTEFTPDEYVNSYYENGANLTKEFLGKHVIDDAGNVLSGQGKMTDAAKKASKYFLRQIDAAQMAGVDLRKAGIPDVDELTRRTLALDRTRGKSKEFARVLKGEHVDDVLGWKPTKDTPAWTDEEFVKRVIEATSKLDGEVIKHSSVVGIAGDLSKVESFATRKAAELLGRPSWAPPVRRPHYTDPGEETDRSRREFDAGPGAELEGLRNAVGAGRHLTPDQRFRMATLHGDARDQQRFERLASAARLSGADAREVDETVRAARTAAGAGDWRKEASSRLDAAIKRRASATGPADPGAGGAAAAPLRESLGLGDSIAPDARPDRAQLTEALRATGHHVANDGASAPTADSLKTQIEAGRMPLVLIDPAGGDQPAWTPVTRVEQDGEGEHWVVTQDAATGAEVSWPADLFEARSRGSHAVVVDPYRTSDGGLRRPAEAETGLPSTTTALPLPGEDSAP